MGSYRENAKPPDEVRWYSPYTKSRYASVVCCGTELPLHNGYADGKARRVCHSCGKLYLAKCLWYKKYWVGGVSLIPGGCFGVSSGL